MEGKYSGTTLFEAKRLKALEDENARLKRLLAGQMPDMATTKEPESEMVTPAVKREVCRARGNRYHPSRRAT